MPTTTTHSSSAPMRPSPVRRRGKRIALLVFFICNSILFSSLGVWQIQRLGWKQQLIARIEQRIHAQPVAAPLESQWATLTRQTAEYRRIHLQGELLTDKEVAVYASTQLGPGYWIMAPLLVDPSTQDANPGKGQSIVWINRGYVPMELRSPDSRLEGPTRQHMQIIGLLRMPDEPNLFLRDNVPSEDRWYRRSPLQFSAERGLPVAQTAPYFVDAQEASSETPWLNPGLTQINFSNNHLSYAITWFVLALLNVAAFIFLLWFEPRLRNTGTYPDEDL